MRKLFFTIILSLSFSLAGFSQTVNGVQLKDIDVEYIQIKGYAFGSIKCIIDVDYGQESILFTSIDNRLKDKDGKAMRFNSMIEALNFMHSYGYEYVDSNMVIISGDSETSYILRKKKVE